MAWRESELEYTDEVTGETTLGRMFEDAAERHANRPAQHYKGGVYDRSLAGSVVPAAPEGEYRPMSYERMRDVVRNLAAGFRDLGVADGARVGLFAHTRMEWAQTDFAVLAAGGVVTTVYTGSSPKKVNYLLGDADADGVVVENAELLERVLAVEDDLDLEYAVVIDEGDLPDREDVFTLAEVHDRGAEAFDRQRYESWLDERELEDLASLIYTSGTTGQPKGVRLTHRNFRSNVGQVRKRYGPRPDKDPETAAIDAETKTVSYLPLAHVFERTAGHFLMFASGASVAYAETPDTLQEDFSLVEPTAATSVPRVYEKIYDGVREQASESALGRRVFPWAVDVGRAYYDADDPGIGLRLKQSIADRLVFSNVREALGGNVEMLISGGGSLSPDLAKLFHAMGLSMLEGYGLTETAPVVSSNPPEEPKIGTIGPPLPGVEVRVDESAAGELRPKSGGEVGELLVKGPNVTDGYWEMPDATGESFTDDGWFRTGDVVEIRPDDYMQFRERSKQLLVLSTGKNVAPGPIEDAFASNELVEQVMAVGDGEKFVGALVVPNLDRLREWADAEGMDLPADPAAACDDERAHERIAEEVEEVNEAFESYERIKKFRLVPEEFTEENGMLTPTLKKKRRTILERYREQVDDIYTD